jgi:hypothetical protein
VSTAHPLVAVVTPASTGEPRIAECVDSVLRQTYPHWEYVLVDSGSGGRTGDMLDAYAQRDPRIRVHRAGPMATPMQCLNHALRLISPESRYCKVVSAEDWLFPHCLEQMVAVAEAHPRVAVVGAYALQHEYVGFDGLRYSSPVLPGRDACRQTLLRGLEIFGTPTTVLWRADTVRARDAFYDEASFHAHPEACYSALRDADFGFVHQLLSCTRPDPAGLAHRAHAGVLGRLVCWERYAPVFLTAAEIARVAGTTSALWRDYYTILGRCLLQNKGQEFWDYHRAQLRGVGKTIEPLRLAAGVARSLLDLVRHLPTLPAAMQRRFFAARA